MTRPKLNAIPTRAEAAGSRDAEIAASASAGRARFVDPATGLSHAHELCTCGHCRCQHAAGVAGCTITRGGHACGRYTWAGPGSDLPERHGHAKRRPRRRGP